MGTMEHNCDHTRPVSRWSWLTNNGYWYKDNKADGRMIIMSTRANGEGLTQLTVLLLQWGVERARCPVPQYLLSQGQQGWGPNKLTIATRLSHHSKCQDALEWVLESIANPTTIISLSRKWDLFSTHGRLQPGNTWPVAVISSPVLAAQERRPEPTQVVKPLELFLTGIEQPLAESSTREGKRTAASRPYGTP